MPKDEFDFDDPMELSGVAFRTEEDTSEAMTECFAEEFLRMGYNGRQVLALFKDTNYVGPNMVLQNRGEPFVREVIRRVFAQWGRLCEWDTPAASPTPHPAETPPTSDHSHELRFTQP